MLLVRYAKTFGGYPIDSGIGTAKLQEHWQLPAIGENMLMMIIASISAFNLAIYSPV
jgi:hypothetical protein